MCGRFAQPHDSEQLARIFRARPTVDMPGQQFNVAPTDQVAGVVEHHGERLIEPFQWGLVPWFAEDQRGGARLINARAETVERTPAFRVSFARRRLIIPAAAFYEWHRSDGRRQPFAVRRRDGELLALAGVWAVWADPDTGERLYTCSIITTPPNELVSPIHDRMPLILDPSDWDLWLSEEADLAEVRRLLSPFPAGPLDAYRVSAAVNNVRNDGAELLVPLA